MQAVVMVAQIAAIPSLEFKKGMRCVWRGCQQPSSPLMDGFTALLDRYTPGPKHSKNAQTEKHPEKYDI